VIRAKHKNFEIMLCPEKFLHVRENYRIWGKNFKFFVCLRKIRDIREKFWCVRKNFGMFAKFTAYYGKFFDMSGKNFLVTSPPLAKNFGEKY
jgi:hypothetical protein